MVKFYTNATFHSNEFLHSDKEVIAGPVREGQRLAVAATPRLPAVNVSNNRGHIVLRHHQPIRTAKGTIDKVVVVVDVVEGREERGVHPGFSHQLTQFGQSAFHLVLGKDGGGFLTIVDGEGFGHHEELSYGFWVRVLAWHCPAGFVAWQFLMQPPVVVSWKSSAPC